MSDNEPIIFYKPNKRDIVILPPGTKHLEIPGVTDNPSSPVTYVEPNGNCVQHDRINHKLRNLSTNTETDVL